VIDDFLNYNLYAIRFKPKITPKAASSKTAPETAEERSYRFSFQPEIDPISKELGRSPDLKELVENTRGDIGMHIMHSRSRDVVCELTAIL
jgi:hypothetical protein